MKIFAPALKKSNYRYFAIAWALLIIIISTIPNLPQPEFTSKSGFSLRLDYLFHFLVYFILAYFVTIWQINNHAQLSTLRFLIIIFSGILFGFLDEWHQILIPGRKYNPLDFLSNAAGFTSGIVFSYFFVIQFLVLRKNKFKTIARKMFTP